MLAAVNVATMWPAKKVFTAGPTPTHRRYGAKMSIGTRVLRRRFEGCASSNADAGSVQTAPWTKREGEYEPSQCTNE